ncbi:MAG TPA: disulfide oxidoreductase [Candidatus Limnocylindrales bacterium]|jgi:disulfide bond formation protein DsbB|nr:disulfide oxidoreductase [Candidatus Limnocylindrales bacterium]
MSATTVELFYAILAVAAMITIAALAVLRLLALVSDAARERYDDVAATIAPHALSLAWFVALLATTGSLYFSEIAGFTPCTLCWYQRIAMYPLVVILAIGAARRERAAAWYAGALAGIGAVISAYHVALEWIPSLDTGACAASTPCTLVWFRMLGFISLPTLALTAFLLILTLLIVRPSAAAMAATLDRHDPVEPDPARSTP